MNRKHVLAALGGIAIAGIAALGAGPSVHAQSIACGQTYTVKRGDSLSQIARRVYGDVSGYAAIFNANSSRIGGDPSLIEVGMVLDIPCLDGSASTPSTADASKIRDAKTTNALPPPGERVIRILTAGNWAPFLDEDQEQGGMFIEIVNVAMKRADGRPKYKIDFINDWGAHLQPLLSDHAYDLGVAWFKPNCAVIDKLGDGSKFRCNNLDWSAPIFEQIVGYYTRADFPAPDSHAALFGSKVCRPAGYSTFMLEERDLVAPNIEFLQPAGPDEAFQMLLDGRCDVVALAIDVSEGAIARLGAAETVTLHDNLNQVAGLAVVISKTHPQGADILATFDDGLKKIKEDGTWFSIVQRHMAEHKARTAGN